MISCLITGCSLIISSENRSAWGDLHVLDGHTFVFHACINADGSTASRLALNGDKSITIDSDAAFFEKRGVFIFSEKDSKFNDSAVKYVAQSLIRQSKQIQIGD